MDNSVLCFDFQGNDGLDVAGRAEALPSKAGFSSGAMSFLKPTYSVRKKDKENTRKGL